MRPVLVIVSGPPASGKTTISRKLADALRLPLFSKDSIKESLFDQLGYSDRTWSKKLGAAAVELLYSIMEAELRAGRAIVLESNFKPELDTARLLSCIAKFEALPIQVACFADGSVLFERFEKRAKSGERHPGHADVDNLEEFHKNLSSYTLQILDIDGEVINVDTTDFSSVDTAGIIERIRAILT